MSLSLLLANTLARVLNSVRTRVGRWICYQHVRGLRWCSARSSPGTWRHFDGIVSLGRFSRRVGNGRSCGRLPAAATLPARPPQRAQAEGAQARLLVAAAHSAGGPWPLSQRPGTWRAHQRFTLGSSAGRGRPPASRCGSSASTLIMEPWQGTARAPGTASWYTGWWVLQGARLFLQVLPQEPRLGRGRLRSAPTFYACPPLCLPSPPRPPG